MAAAMIMSANVCATNGMFTIGNSTKSRGMGGVSMTMTHDTLTSAINPATLAHAGTRFDIGGDILFTDGESTFGQEGFGKLTVKSEPVHFTIADGIYVLPHMGGSIQKGDITYGFTMVGVGGGGSRYEPNLFNTVLGGPIGDELGVSLLVMNMNPTIAIKLDENHSVGASLIIGIQVFKAFGLKEFTTFTTTQDDTAKLTNQGAEVTYGAGVRIGWLGQFMDNNLSLGASYTSKTYMKEFNRYTDLFAEQGDFDTPGNIGIGAAYKFTEDLTIAMDINYVMYEDVAAVSNPGPNSRSSEPFPVDRDTNALGKDGGLGFGWDNQTVFKIGASYQYAPNITLRAGWNYAKSPIDEEHDVLFNIVAPATTQNHLTLGATYNLNQKMEISLSFVHAFEHSQKGPTYIGFESEISMEQNLLGGSFAYRF